MNQVSPLDPPTVLPPALMDQLDEMIATSSSSADRAVAVTTLVQLMYEATSWLHDFDLDHDELASLAAVLAAAAAHQARMQAG